MASCDKARLFAVAFLLCAFVSACGGGGSSGAANAPLGPPQQAAPSVSPSSVRVAASAQPASMTVSESGYAGSFTVNAASCAGIASVVQATPVTIVPGSALFAITGVAPGTCTVTFTDALSRSAAASVTVT